MNSRLVEYLPEPGFDFERAYVARVDGVLQPVAVIGGVIVNIYTKPTLLEIGVACCIPLEEKWGNDWPLSVTVEINNGDGAYNTVVPNATADPPVVAAARQYMKFLESESDRGGTGAVSVPHTGKLFAKVRGLNCVFDGDTWNTPDATLTDLLNAATSETPKHHNDIPSVARHVFHSSGLENEAEIVWFKGDAWVEDLPPGAID